MGTDDTHIKRISRIPSDIRFYKDQKPELCELAVKRDPHSLRFIKNKTVDLIAIAVEQDYMAFRHVTEEEQTEEVIQKVLGLNGNCIRYIGKLSRDHIKMAVMTNPSLIRDFQNDEELCIIAIQRDPLCIQHIDKPSPEIQTLAIQLNKNAAYYIKKLYEKLHEKIIVEMIDEDPENILHLHTYDKLPDPYVCLHDDVEKYMQENSYTRVRDIFSKSYNEWHTNYFPKMCFYICQNNENRFFNYATDLMITSVVQADKEYVKKVKDTALVENIIMQTPEVIRHLKNPSIKLQELAFEKDNSLIVYMSREFQIVALEKTPRLISYFFEPDEELQFIAIKKDIKSLYDCVYSTYNVMKYALEKDWRMYNDLSVYQKDVFSTEHYQFVKFAANSFNGEHLCGICLAELKTCCKLECNHEFHNECLDELLKEGVVLCQVCDRIIL